MESGPTLALGRWSLALGLVSLLLVAGGPLSPLAWLVLGTLNPALWTLTAIVAIPAIALGLRCRQSARGTPGTGMAWVGILAAASAILVGFLMAVAPLLA